MEKKKTFQFLFRLSCCMISYAYSTVLTSNAYRASIDWTVAFFRRKKVLFFFPVVHYFFFFVLQIRFVSIKEYLDVVSFHTDMLFIGDWNWDKNRFSKMVAMQRRWAMQMNLEKKDECHFFSISFLLYFAYENSNSL